MAVIITISIQIQGNELLFLGPLEKRTIFQQAHCGISTDKPDGIGEIDREIGGRIENLFRQVDSLSFLFSITPQQLTETDLQNVLGRYLPAETFQ